MMAGAFVALVGFAAFAIDVWSIRLSDLLDPLGARVTPEGRAELVLRQDRVGHYTAPGTINGVDAVFLLDTGATGVAVPPVFADRLGLERGLPVEIVTATEVAPASLVWFDRVGIGPLERRRVSLGAVRGTP